MKSIKRRCISLVLAFVLLCSLFPASLAVSSSAQTEYVSAGQSNTAASATNFTDVTDVDWFEIYVNRCVEAGLLNGVGDGLFNPYGTVNVDEALVMAARVLWLADGGTGDLPEGPSPEEFLALLGEDSASCPFAVDLETATRYAESWAWDGMTYLVLRAKEEGFSLNLDASPEYPASRRLFFKALAFASQSLNLPAINEISSVPDTRDEDILQLYQAGILTGSDAYGSFEGQRTLTRAEAAAALARLMDASLRASFAPADSPYQSYTLTKLTDGSLFAGGPSTGLCAVATEDGQFFLTLEGELIPWPDGGTPSSALTFFLDYVEIGVWATPEAAETGYGDINMGMMDRDGEFVVPLGTYDLVQPAQDGNLIACNGTNSWFLLSSDGTLIAQLPQLEGNAAWWSFNDGLLPLQDAQSGLFGFVDQTGAWVLAPQWQAVSSEGFSGGYTAVQDESGLWGVIDTTGKEILPCQYQWIVCPENSADYTGPTLFLTVNTLGEMMWISPEGELYPADPAFAYSDGTRYHNGYAVCWTDTDSYYTSCCYLDLTGQTVSESFDWAGPIGADGRGFVGLDGAVYRIEFVEEQTLVPVQPDDSQEVLDFVDSLFAAGGVSLRCWLFPGSGSLSLSMDGYYGQIRALFAEHTWVRQEEALSEQDTNSWSVNLLSSGQVSIAAATGSNCITVTVSGSNAQTICYQAEDSSGDLVLSLSELWDGPDIRLALVTVNEQDLREDDQITEEDSLAVEEDDMALAEAYAAAFQNLYLESGAITAFELQELTVLAPEDAAPIYYEFRMIFAVKPADPSVPCWKGTESNKDGWVSFDCQLSLILEEDGIWRCEWLQ